MSRPDYVTEYHLSFLDELRESGDTNMFGARSYLMAEFPELANDEAGVVLSYWMRSFGKKDR